MATGETLLNALLGAVATIVLTPFVPFAPTLGGVVAGYLEGGDRSDGLRVGAVSGIIALVPLFLVMFLIANFFAFFFLGAMGPGRMMGGFGLVALVFLGVFAVTYTVGLSALGGWLGNYIRTDTDVGTAA
jgi:uncharacterized membrane protein (GlpM family)